jgi:hypothetical protein
VVSKTFVRVFDYNINIKVQDNYTKCNKDASLYVLVVEYLFPHSSKVYIIGDIIKALSKAIPIKNMLPQEIPLLGTSKTKVSGSKEWASSAASSGFWVIYPYGVEAPA